jgi:serine/threonine-protein kinase ATR
MLVIEDEVEIMNSMQKPRKITVRGTDGLRYPFLVKPKDDLRKDARLMEFNSIINKLLKRDVESSRRQLCRPGKMCSLTSRHSYLFSRALERRTRHR